MPTATDLPLTEIIARSKGRIQPDDLSLLMRACDAAAAKTILEIGSADGGSSVVLGTKAAERDGHLYCVEQKPKACMVENMKHYGLEGRYTLIEAASPWLGALAAEVPESLDLLFIDGSHEVRAAIVDYHYFAPRVRPGGVIVFHDTGGHCEEDRRQPDFGRNDYVPLVRRAIELILTTDDLTQIDESRQLMGGAIAYRKGGAL